MLMIKLKDLLTELKMAKKYDHTGPDRVKKITYGLKARGNKHKLKYDSMSKQTFDMDLGNGMLTFNLKDLLDASGSYGFNADDIYMDDADLVYKDETIGKWKGMSYWDLLNLLRKKKIIRKY